MTEQTQINKGARHEIPSPFAGMNTFVQKEFLRVADESEKALERSMQETKRAMHEGSRVLEGQIELGQSMMRAWFDSARRIWNV
jgi:hypothetical protein